MPQNNQLQSLLEKAKHVCQNKHSQVNSNLNGSPSTRFLAINSSRSELFALLIQPAFFVEDHPAIDQVILTKKTTAIDVLDPSQFDQYLNSMEEYLSYLRTEVLPHLQNELLDNQTIDWNLKTLDALRMMRRKITGRKRFFSNLGDDIGELSVYVNHKKSRKDYREKLKNNSIQSVASDELVLLGFKEEVTGLEVLEIFKEIIERANVFMDEKRKIDENEVIV